MKGHQNVFMFAVTGALAMTSLAAWFYFSLPRRHIVVTESSGDFGNVSSISSSPAVLPRRTFWTSDIHDGARVDTPSVLLYLNQTVIVNGHKGKHSHYYSEVLQKTILPGDGERSAVIQSHKSQNDYISERDIKANFDFFKSNERIAATDAFICSFPASFCEMWMPFNKSIVFLPAHRFSLGRCSRTKLERLIEHIQQLNARSSQPKHFIASSSVYDAEYLNYYTGVTPILLSSNAFFYAGRGATKYTQARKEILFGPPLLTPTQLAVVSFIKDAAARRSKKEKWQFATVKELYGTFKLQNIADHRAVVLLPYAVMTYGISELYAMAIPLLVPSINWLVTTRFRILDDRSLIDPCYCDQQMASQLPPKHQNSRHPYSPDTYEHKAFRYWLQFADFYQWPHITVFEDFDDMIDKLEAMNFTDIHHKMLEANEKREKELLDNWRQIILHIETGRQVPQHYRKAIKKLWNTDRLQVE